MGRKRSGPIGCNCIHAAGGDSSRVVYATSARRDGRDLRRVPAPRRPVVPSPHGMTVRGVLTDNAMSYRCCSAWCGVQRAAGRAPIHQALLPVDRRQVRATSTGPLLTDRAYARPLEQQHGAQRQPSQTFSTATNAPSTRHTRSRPNQPSRCMNAANNLTDQDSHRHGRRSSRPSS